jgi:hypothetical protein
MVVAVCKDQAVTNGRIEAPMERRAGQTSLRRVSHHLMGPSKDMINSIGQAALKRSSEKPKKYNIDLMIAS